MSRARPRIERLARKLQKEAASFVDYPAIEKEAEALGFPTSVRTLRFYVSEGVLPAPRRQGKTPVYPREWILNALLAIHLMKTRLRRSLAEIRAVMERLTESPELLAEQCTQLHELASEPGSLGPSAARVLADRFFERLAAGRQPSDVRITELVKDLEEERGAAPGGFSFQYGPRSGRPTAPRPVARSGRAVRRAASEGSGDGTVRPDGARSMRQARDLENVFIRHFEAAYRSLTSVYQPADGKRYPTRASGREPAIADEYLRVVEILKEARCFERELFDSLPLDKSTRFDVTSGGRRHEALAVLGVSWSPTEDFVRAGASSARAGGTDLCRVLDRHLVQDSVFYYVGVHSTVGWEPEVARYLPRGDNYRVALVEYDDDIGWRVWNDFPPEAGELVRLFDPEPFEEKVERCLRRIGELEELRVRGGFVPVDELAGTLRVTADVVEESLKRIETPGNGLKLTTVRGRRLLQRDRLSSGRERKGPC